MSSELSDNMYRFTGLGKTGALIPMLVFIFSSFSFMAHAQGQKEGQRGDMKKIVLAPMVLITAGLVSFTDNDLLSREDVWEARQRFFPGFRSHADDYIQYLPAALCFGLKGIGIEGNNKWLDALVLLASAEMIMTSMVVPLKKITRIPRPDTGARSSFPSGHTAQAFVAATFLHKEMGKDRPWVSIVAYSLASSVGIMRVMNDRHWLSDILAGAGIGILSTNIAYHTKRALKDRRMNIDADLSLGFVHDTGIIRLNISI